ncbi:Hsp70 family protein [Dactylosporangium sp. CS-033363]|uniref:Hsp70 family protein n=1 Tax=Dactylosporangium sp. CS-033363 TaxID=3239935 RepID=UPI003D90A78A
MTGLRLGIDFGTSNTAAVLRLADGTIRSLVFDGSELLPSAVCRAVDGTLLVGRDAIRAARTDPSAFEPHPKRCIDDGTVVLGGHEVPVAAVIGAVLRRVFDEAVRVAGEQPAQVTIACPAGWGPRRREVLLEAARDAGMHGAELVAEPVAAARAHGGLRAGDNGEPNTSAGLGPGGTALIYDLGAGTFDVSVLRRTADGFDVLAEAGLDDAGGLEVDAAIVTYLGAVYSGRDAGTWRRLMHPQSNEDRRAARQLWDDVRAAKESLARATATVIHVPLFADDAPFGREQLDLLASPILDRTVHQARAVLREASMQAEDLDAVLLVGGGSRLPLVATMLHRRLGRTPVSTERPELIVAEGATLTPKATTPPQAAPPPRTAPPPRATPPRPPRAAPPGPPRARPATRPGIMPKKRRRWPVVLAVLVLLAAGAAYASNAWLNRCLTLSLVSSDEKAPVLTELARQYRDSGRETAGRCVDIGVTIGSSRMVADALATGASWEGRARPDIWSPSSSVWTERLRAARPAVLPAGELPSVTRTPVVIGMPKPMAEALGWPKARIGWSDLAALAADPRGWGAKGHPEWGPFTLGKTNPNTSTTGLLSFASTAKALGSAPERLRSLELATVHYGSSSSTFTKNLYQADQVGRGLEYVSAIALEEQVIFQYNRGNLLDGGQQAPPKTPLVAIYPSDGTIASDDPYAILHESWVSPDQSAAAEDFLRYIHEPAQAALFLDEGFRDVEDHAGKWLLADPGLQSEPSFTTVAPPDAKTVETLLALWNQVRKPASVLIVVDESGSMIQEVGDSDKTRLQLAKEAATPAVDTLAATDEIGLWAFSGPETSGADPWRELMPLSPVGAAKDKYRQSVQVLRAHGETALYATIRSAVSRMKDAQNDRRIYAVVVLSDGENQYPADDDLNKLVDELGKGSLEKPVRVFTIAYGSDADNASLDRIASASRGGSYDATNALDIRNVFNDVLSNF